VVHEGQSQRLGVRSSGSSRRRRSAPRSSAAATRDGDAWGTVMVMGMAMDRRSEYSRGVLLLLERRMDKADAHVTVAADQQRRA
jgi:hypothetical protein